MKKKTISDELVVSKIYTIRGQKVMLDRDLAELYEVENRALKQAVRRNMERFPEDFMIELTSAELDQWRTQHAADNREVMGLRIAPFAFTEHGVLMLSSVLKSAKAIEVNIQIIRVFNRIREMWLTHKELMLELEKIRGTMGHHGRDLKVIFGILKRMEHEEKNRRLLAQIAKEKKEKPRPVVGFKKGKDKSEE